MAGDSGRRAFLGLRVVWRSWFRVLERGGEEWKAREEERDMGEGFEMRDMVFEVGRRVGVKWVVDVRSERIARRSRGDGAAGMAAV